MAKDFATAFTVTVASPAVFTATEHNLNVGDEIILFTTGALPTNLNASSAGSYYSYFVIVDGFTANTFQVALYKEGTPINTSGTQSGTHTFIRLNGHRLIPKGINYI